jgi:hypothetical protein
VIQDPFGNVVCLIDMSKGARTSIYPRSTNEHY